MEGRTGNQAGESELQNLAMSHAFQILHQIEMPREVIRHLETKPGKYGHGVAAHGLAAYGVGPTPECSKRNALCSINLTYRYLSDYQSNSLQKFVRETGQPSGVLEKVACCFKQGPIVGELVVRVCRGREIPALPWGREAVRFVGFRRPAGQEPRMNLSGPTPEIRRLMDKRERFWRRFAGLPVVKSSEAKDSSGVSGTLDSLAEGRGDERREIPLDLKSACVRHDEGGVLTRASVVVDETSSKQSSMSERNNTQSGFCTRTHIPLAYRQEVESGEFGEQYVRHYNMIWAAIQGCVICVKAYQEVGGSKLGEKCLDVWSGTCQNEMFNAWRASYVNQSEKTVLKQEEVRTYLRSLEGSEEKIEWTRSSELWQRMSSTEMTTRSLLQQAEKEKKGARH